MSEKIFVLIPAYNEAESIGYTIDGIKALFPNIDIILCDNGSTDETVQIGKKRGVIITEESQKGYGRALMKGIEWIQQQNFREDLILIFMDGDGADNPEDIAQHLKNLESHEFSIASRTEKILPEVMKRRHFLANKIFGFLLFLRTGKKFTDLGPFRALRLSTLKKLHMSDFSYGWTAEMQRKIALQKIPYAEFFSAPRKRFGGTSKISGSAFWKQLKIGLHIIWRIFV